MVTILRWEIHCSSTDANAGYSLSLSHDGKTITAGYRRTASGAGGDAGQIRVHTYVNGAWTQKGLREW